jgi:2-polyprenyl-3-methyl-5-hydroxy-6-metoxy-1,4-benzoquinol methylase
MNSEHALEVRAGERFAFGANWARFLASIDEDGIRGAMAALRRDLGRESLSGLRFLDAGSGSGLTSLAARRLGAEVVSFDFDPQSVECTRELRRRYQPEDGKWVVQAGSILDEEFLQRLGTFDVVCSWGVLHHTGQMHRALKNVSACVSENGMLYIALYNDQGWISGYWKAVKRRYNQGVASRWVISAVHAPYLLGVRWVVRSLTRRRRLERGMSLWYDMLDWLGGLPFEVARPELVVRELESHGFRLQMLRTVGRRNGCNEFVFCRALVR